MPITSSQAGEGMCRIWLSVHDMQWRRDFPFHAVQWIIRILSLSRWRWQQDLKDWFRSCGWTSGLRREERWVANSQLSLNWLLGESVYCLTRASCCRAEKHKGFELKSQCQPFALDENGQKIEGTDFGPGDVTLDCNATRGQYLITVFSCSIVFVRTRALISAILFENENSGRKECECIVGSNFGKNLIEREGWVEGGNPIERERERERERESEREWRRYDCKYYGAILSIQVGFLMRASIH